MSRNRSTLRRTVSAVVARAIRKTEFRIRVGLDTSPYHVALEYGLERTSSSCRLGASPAANNGRVSRAADGWRIESSRTSSNRIMRRTKMRGMPENLPLLHRPQTSEQHRSAAG